jgi:hypothetical protein
MQLARGDGTGAFFLHLAFRLGRFLLSDALADRKGHLAKAFVGVDDYVVAVQDFAIENLQRQRILH